VTAAAQTLLLIEAPDDWSGLEQVLAADGWRVVRGDAVAEAIGIAKREKPAALVFRGAVGPAVALVQKLRCSAHTAQLPVVLVTDAASDVREELARWGAKTILDGRTSDRSVADAARHLVPLPPPRQAPDGELGRADRLRALERTNLLDTAPEESFDLLARLGAQLLDVPVVLLSIVDRQRQFFKAQVGLPAPLNSTRQTPLSHSFCQWVVAAHEELVVEDARKDALLSGNGATLEMGIVAYAGVPVRADADETIGSFCAIDLKPRHWDARELRALHDVAGVAEGLTALRQADRLPPLTLEEFRITSAAAGRAVEAAMRLHEAGRTRMDAAGQHALVALVRDLGHHLVRVSGRA
jgi:hypothetical protein